MLSQETRSGFDAMVDSVIAALPERFAAMLDEVPLIVLDRPDVAMLKELEIDPEDEVSILELYGLHTGAMRTEMSVEDSGELPSSIHIFREGLLALTGGIEGGGEDGIVEQIRITILHELGHAFGLEEDELSELGYE